MTTTPASTGTNLPASKNEMVDQVMSKIQSMADTGLRIPNDYHPENSLRAAWLILQETTDRNGKAILEVCTKPSIANAMLKMVLMGLNPHKHQCAFIAHGDKMTCMPEYAGKIAIARRVGLKAIQAKCVYENDSFDYSIDPETGRTKINEHKQNLANINGGKILAAYAVIELEDGTRDTEIMTMAQIQSAWNQGAAKGQSPAHKNFPDQMCMKTVMSRAIKVLVNSSDDGDLHIDEEREENARTSHANVVKEEIKNNANKEEFVFEDANVVNDGASSSPVVSTATENKEEPKAGDQPGF